MGEAILYVAGDAIQIALGAVVSVYVLLGLLMISFGWGTDTWSLFKKKGVMTSNLSDFAEESV